MAAVICGRNHVPIDCESRLGVWCDVGSGTDISEAVSVRVEILHVARVTRLARTRERLNIDHADRHDNRYADKVKHGTGDSYAYPRT